MERKKRILTNEGSDQFLKECCGFMKPMVVDLLKSKIISFLILAN